MQIATQRIKRQSIPSESLVYTGPKHTEDINITMIAYSEQFYQRHKIQEVGRIVPDDEVPAIRWINVDGIHDVDIVETIGLQFGIHFLVLEDILDVNQRPKYEDYGSYIYMAMKMLYLDDEEQKIVSEQISMVLFQNTLITFQERPGDIFDPIRNRIMNNKGKIRRMGADYLAYSLVDAIVDHYFVLMEEIGEEIAGMEKEILENPTKELLQEIYNLKIDIIFLRKAILPVREVIIKLQKEESDIVHDNLEPYARDLYDHVIHVLENIKTYSDTISGILDIYMSSAQNRMNSEMRKLTLITTVFMPLSVLASVGGMSEYSMMTGSSNWKLSYPAFIIGSIVIGLLTYWFLTRSRLKT